VLAFSGNTKKLPSLVVIQGTRVLVPRCHPSWRTWKKCSSS